MKFFLTIYICSVVSNSCFIPNSEPFMYPKPHNTHAECLQAGLGESYELLYASEYFNLEAINTHRLYPKFFCERVPVREKDQGQES
jgi:hypothetical protein